MKPADEIKSFLQERIAHLELLKPFVCQKNVSFYRWCVMV